MEQQSHSSHAIQAQFPFRCKTPVQLRFNDIDALGHVNNSIYFELMDLAKTDYFSRLGVDQEIDWRHPPIIIANVNCSFLVQTHSDERLEVLTQCQHIGNKSLTLLQEVVNSATGEVKCTCATVMVNLDTTTGMPSPLPQVWRDAIVAFEQHEY